MNAGLLSYVGRRIDAGARAILRQVYGLRIPASRVRLQERLDDRHFVLHQIERAKVDYAYWNGELGRCESAIETAMNDLRNLAIKANSRAGFCACDELAAMDQGHSAPVDSRETGGNT